MSRHIANLVKAGELKKGERIRPVLDCSKSPDMTRQDFKDDCDINLIMAKARKTGMVAHTAKYAGSYGEFMEIDYHEAMTAIAEADQMFETVPSDIRARFGNDAGKFLEFVTNEENADEVREMGLAKPAPRPVQPPASEDDGAATPVATPAST